MTQAPVPTDHAASPVFATSATPGPPPHWHCPPARCTPPLSPSAYPWYSSLYGVIISVFNKNHHVKVGRWASKCRHWWAVARHEVFRQHNGGRIKCQHAPHPSDRFLFQQSGTLASAIDKFLNCDGFLAICCPDATRCLCPAPATQRTGMSSHKPKLRLDPTNVHILLIQQEVIFANWWAQMTPKKPVGLAQRFLFAFGGDADPAGSVCSLCASRGATRHAGY